MARVQETVGDRTQALRSYTTRAGYVLGFHGTDAQIVRDVVLRQRNLTPSSNPWDWIGHGIYFREHSPSRAMEFAIAASKMPGSIVQKPGVLGTILDLGHCLDLLDYDKLQLVKEAYSRAANLPGFNKFENHAPKGSSTGELVLRKLDCFVIETLHNRNRQIDLPPFDSVKAVFWEGNLLYPNAGFREKNHIQICVRNPNCIKGFFIPNA